VMILGPPDGRIIHNHIGRWQAPSPLQILDHLWLTCCIRSSGYRSWDGRRIT
jgi:hypothetical protein